MYSSGRRSGLGGAKGLEEAASVYSPGRSRPGFRYVVAAARLVEALLCNAEMHGSTSSRRESGLGFPPHARAHGAVYGGEGVATPSSSGPLGIPCCREHSVVLFPSVWYSLLPRALCG